MITPRTTRLLRVLHLRAFHRAIADLALDGTVADARRRIVLVPTRSAARQLRRTIEIACADSSRAVALPDIVTRNEWYAGLHAALIDQWAESGADPAAVPPPVLSDFAREVLMHAAAREAVASAEPPFKLRAGLIGAMVDLYDALRRERRTVDAFERLMTGELEPGADSDRGAEQMLRQTCFLAAAFRGYETRVIGSGALDEHLLRDVLLHRPPSRLRHVVVTVADRAADPAGLWPVDFDLLTRLPGLSQIDVVITEAQLASGLEARIRDQLPQIEEVVIGGDGSVPVLVVPTDAREPEAGGAGSLTPAKPYFVARDREEELIAAAADLKRGTATSSQAAVSSRQAIVFRQPLPYLYLATQVLGSARIPFQADDALPLAAEPYSAALDLVFAFVLAQFNRGSGIALLRSPHFQFGGSHGVTAAEVDRLDALLHRARYFGGLPHLEHLAATEPSLMPFFEAARELQPLQDQVTPAQHLDVLSKFLERHDAPFSGPVELLERHLRARSAVLTALSELRDASAAYETHAVPFVDVVSTIRRWIEGQTFAPRRGSVGVQLLDARSACYSDLDELRIVGLIENDWPGRPTRNIFYPPSLLAKLGWPPESARIAFARATFHDLMRLPRRRVTLSTFALENEAVVSPSWLLEEVGEVFPRERQVGGSPGRILQQDALAFDPIVPAAISGEAAWLLHRRSGSRGGERRFHGAAGPQLPRQYAVSAVEGYLDCPFRYYASRVLRLPEARDDEPTLTPQERGRFVHEVFHAFFHAWHAAGRGAIGPDDLGDALQVFREVTEAGLHRVPEAERALERVRLLGSAAAPGLGERVLRFEAERGTSIVERLLEQSIDGEYEFATAAGSRRIQVRGTADRLDLMADGTVRLLDYKTGRAPDRARAVQIPVYAAAAEQRLRHHRERSWRVNEAGYLAFRERDIFVSIAGRGATLEHARADGLQRFVTAIDAIERGEFPPRPADEFMCERCPYPTVCRKDYVGDEQV